MAQLLVRGQTAGLLVAHYVAQVEHHTLVGYRQGAARVLLHEQDRDAAVVAERRAPAP